MLYHWLLNEIAGGSKGISSQLSESDVAKLVNKTAGYSGSDMRNLIQEACQGPVREAITQFEAEVANLSEADLRPVTLKDFQVHLQNALHTSLAYTGCYLNRLTITWYVCFSLA